MVSIFLLVLLLFLILCGAPIGFTLILIPFFYILVTDAVPLVLIPSQMFNAIDSVPLTAIAFFMLTGELMTSATITDRLVALSRALIGRMRGGLAQVNVLVSMFFAGMNGSVVADTATVGALVLPAMKKAGYPPAFSAAVTGVSSTIGGIIPPSIMMIVLANATEISVAALFAAGIVPGLLIGAVIMLINHFFAIKYNFERSDESFSVRRAGKELYRSSFALLIPVVLVGSLATIFASRKASKSKDLSPASIASLKKSIAFRYSSCVMLCFSQTFPIACIRSVVISPTLLLIISSSPRNSCDIHSLYWFTFILRHLLSIFSFPLMTIQKI